MTSICRPTSNSIAFSTKRNELRFLISVLTPNFSVPRGAHRNVHVASHAALSHPRVGNFRVAKNRMQRAQICARILGAAHVGLADDLDQRHARAIEVDQRAIGLMDVFAGVFLEMDSRQAHALGLAALERDLDIAALADRRFVLADLIALRQVGIEVAFAIENRFARDLAVRRESRAHREFDRLAIEHRQHARHPHASRADVFVGLRAECRRASAEHFRFGREMRVDFEADNRFVFFLVHHKIHQIFSSRGLNAPSFS